MKEKPSKKSKSEDIFNPAPASEDRESHTLLGQVLVELGYITIYQLDEALQVQRTEFQKEAKPLGQVLLELGYCSPNQLIRAIQVQTDYRKAIARAHSD
jgi:hypothetical protein